MRFHNYATGIFWFLVSTKDGSWTPIFRKPYLGEVYKIYQEGNYEIW